MSGPDDRALVNLPDPAVIWCPFPDRDTAMQVAHVLLDEELIACANILPGMTSVFVWNGRKDEGQETAALFKTNTAMMARAIARLNDLHPYDEPAVLGWRCEGAAAGTVAWLARMGR